MTIRKKPNRIEIYLHPEDVIRGTVKPSHKLGIPDFKNLPVRLVVQADLITFTDSEGSERILKKV